MSIEVKDAYSTKYVAYLDLLGFKTKVNDAHTDPEVRKEILEVLDILRDTVCNKNIPGMRLTHFSDCMIITVNQTREGLWEILYSISLLARNLLNYDYLVRGGLAVGGAHHDELFVYGTAVNEAYRMESQDAHFPRTIVSNEVLANARAYDSRFEEEFLTQDQDGRYFIHYLKLYAEYTRLPLLPGKVMLDESGKRIVDFICHRLNTHSDPKVVENDAWFQGYWNDKVANRGVFGRINKGVLERDLGHAPTIIKRRRLS